MDINFFIDRVYGKVVGIDLGQIYIIVFMMVLLVCLSFWLIARQNKTIRAKTVKQALHIRKAKKAYKVLRKRRDIGHSKSLDIVRRDRGFDGWTFEMLVLLTLKESIPNVIYVGSIKLTGDYGLDGVVVSKNDRANSIEIYMIQSKFYTEYVSIGAIEDIAKKASYFNRRKKNNGWHKILGIPRKYVRNANARAIPVMATSGKIGAKGSRAAQHGNVQVIDWEALVRLIRKKA